MIYKKTSKHLNVCLKPAEFSDREILSKEIFKSDSNKIQTVPCFLRFLYFIFYLVLRTERIGADLEDDEREDLLFTDFELPDFTDERDVVVPREERTELFTSFSVAF